jgi:hypothetical protein
MNCNQSHLDLANSFVEQSRSLGTDSRQKSFFGALRSWVIIKISSEVLIAILSQVNSASVLQPIPLRPNALLSPYLQILLFVYYILFSK